METFAIMDLTQVKGIGAKRATQLEALGINNINELAKASAKILAKKRNFRQEIIVKWISSAKELAQ